MTTYYAVFKASQRHPGNDQTPEANENGWVEVSAGGILEAQALVESHYGNRWEEVLTARGLSDFLKAAERVLPLGPLGTIDFEFDGAPDESYPGQRADLATEAEGDREAFEAMPPVTYIAHDGGNGYRYQVILSPLPYGVARGNLGSNAVITVLQPYVEAKAVTVYQGQELREEYIHEHLVAGHGTQHLPHVVATVNAAIAACNL